MYSQSYFFFFVRFKVALIRSSWLLNFWMLGLILLRFNSLLLFHGLKIEKILILHF